MDELKEKRAKRAGIVTPLALLEDAKDKLRKGEINRVIVIALTPDGDPFAGWSEGMQEYEMLGTIEAGKNEILGMLGECEDD